MKTNHVVRLAAAVLPLLAAPSSAFAQPHCCAAQEAPAQRHMLFRVTGPNGASVFLLGSVHLLSAEAGKLPAVVDSAFARSKTVAFETSFDSLQQRAMEMVMRGRYSNGATL